METVKVSPKFQVVIPRKIRESLGIRPGQRIQVLVYEGRVEFIPLRRMKEMRGFLRGIDTTVERDQDRMNVVDSSGWLENLRTVRMRISSHLRSRIWRNCWSRQFLYWKFSRGLSNNVARARR